MRNSKIYNPHLNLLIIYDGSKDAMAYPLGGDNRGRYISFETAKEFNYYFPEGCFEIDNIQEVDFLYKNIIPINKQKAKDEEPAIAVPPSKNSMKKYLYDPIHKIILECSASDTATVYDFGGSLLGREITARFWYTNYQNDECFEVSAMDVFNFCNKKMIPENRNDPKSEPPQAAPVPVKPTKNRKILLKC